LISKSTEPQTAESTYLYALRLLTGRDYTATGMLRKFSARGVCELDAETVIARLQREGWLNDRRYAERFAESVLSNGRFFGPRLRQEMLRRGFGADLVGDVLTGLSGDFDEGDEVRKVLERRYSGFCFSTATDREKRKIIGYLQRRGFGLSAIMNVLKAAK